MYASSACSSCALCMQWCPVKRPRAHWCHGRFPQVNPERNHHGAGLPVRAAAAADLTWLERDCRLAGEAGVGHDVIVALEALAWDELRNYIEVQEPRFCSSLFRKSRSVTSSSAGHRAMMCAICTFGWRPSLTPGRFPSGRTAGATARVTATLPQPHERAVVGSKPTTCGEAEVAAEPIGSEITVALDEQRASRGGARIVPPRLSLIDRSTSLLGPDTWGVFGLVGACKPGPVHDIAEREEAFRHDSTR